MFEKFLNDNSLEYIIEIVSDGSKEMRKYTVDGKTYGAFKKDFLERALETLKSELKIEDEPWNKTGNTNKK